MPILNSEKWSFTSFSASCIRCDCSSEPGDMFYSGLTAASDESGQNEDGKRTRAEPDPDDDADRTEDSSDGPAFERVDYCSDCWESVTPDLFSYWKTEVPEPEDDDREPDRSTLAGLFRGLIQQREKGQEGDESTGGTGENDEQTRDPLNQGLLYLLSLMLLRKGFLALENKEVQEGQDQLHLRVRGTDDERYSVHEPELDSETREQVKTKLADLLDMERDEPE